MTSKSGPPRKRGGSGGSNEIRQATGDALGHGITIAASIALFLWLGDLLDGRLGTSPLFALSGMMLGAGAGFYRLYVQMVLIPRQKQEEQAAAEKERGVE